MARRGRSLQFSLKCFFVVLTIGCLGLGWKVERARKQRRLAEDIWALGGGIWYDWQLDFTGFPDSTGPLIKPNAMPTVPAWLRQLCGDDMFQDVEMVIFASSSTRESDILRSVLHLKQLPRLKAVWVGYWVSKETKDKLKVALPGCQINTFASR
jgi:hypothetical protein